MAIKKKISFDLPIEILAKGQRIDLNVIFYSGPDLSQLDEEGRRLYYRMCDLAARFWLNDNAQSEYAAANFDGSCSMIHAERYLSDRLVYELFPWPKGKLKIESED